MSSGVHFSSDGFIQFGDGEPVPVADIRIASRPGSVRAADGRCLHPRDHKSRLPRNGEVQYPVLCVREAGHEGQHHYATFPGRPTIQGEIIPPTQVNKAIEPSFADIWDFIAAQLRQDEIMAFDASDRRSGRWFVGDKWNVYGVEDETPHEDCETNELIVYGNMKVQSEHIACWDPARALLEVASKRRILERHRRPRSPAELPAGVPSESCIGCGFLGDNGIPARTPHIDLCPELRDAAAPYAERPGYKPAWRPA